MILNVLPEILNFEQQPVESGLTIRKCLVNALLAPYQDENIDGTEKLRRYELAKKIYKEDNVKLLSEDIVLLKQLVAKMYATIVVGPIFELLEESVP